MKYKNILTTTQRFREILGKFAQFGFADVLETEQMRGARQWIMARTGQDPVETPKVSTPERARLLLQDLGPTFVKFGQMAASQSSSLPQVWGDELAKLQSDVPPFEYAQVESIIERELGKPPHEVFAEFSQEPLAAASIGQVHRATRHDGEKVAIKIQRPNIMPKIQEDLSIMHSLAVSLEGTTKAAKELGAVRSVDEFATSLMEELSYRHEARNTERLSKNLENFPRIRAPKIYWDTSSDRVLTMEFIVGVKVTDIEALDAAGINRHELCTDFVRCVGQQILVDGFFHADPHPGNISVTLDTHELVFLDMGMMGFIDKNQRRELTNLMLAIFNRDSVALTRVAFDLGTPFREVNRPKLTRDIERLLAGLLDAPLREVGAGSFWPGSSKCCTPTASSCPASWSWPSRRSCKCSRLWWP